MKQAPGRQGYPPLEGMYAVSPASTSSFSDGVNQHCFCWHQWSRDSFHQVSLWLCFFYLPIRILFANGMLPWMFFPKRTQQRTHMHFASTLWSILPSWRKISTMKLQFCDTEELLSHYSYLSLWDGFPCNKHETHIHRHSRLSFNPTKNQQQYFMDFQNLGMSSSS